MRTKEQLANSLMECLREVSALLEHAHSVALKQQSGLVNNDAEIITQTCKMQEEILRHISDSDQRAANIAEDLIKLTGIDPESANTETIADAVGFPYSDIIKQQTASITKLAAKVQEANEINAVLLKNGLEIIACCLKTLATDSSPIAYNNSALISGVQPQILSLDLRA